MINNTKLLNVPKDYIVWLQLIKASHLTHFPFSKTKEDFKIHFFDVVNNNRVVHYNWQWFRFYFNKLCKLYLLKDHWLIDIELLYMAPQLHFNTSLAMHQKSHAVDVWCVDRLVLMFGAPLESSFKQNWTVDEWDNRLFAYSTLSKNRCKTITPVFSWKGHITFAKIIWLKFI